MELHRIAKRGANKVLSEESWISASFREGFKEGERGLRSVSIWFREPTADDDSRYRVQMTQEEAEELHGNLTRWLKVNTN